MKLAVFGLWHLGTVTAACTAAAGIPTVAVDLDRERIASLAQGEPPLYEPGLAELVKAGIAARTLSFATDVASASDADVVWICHDTPVDEDDRADTDAVRFHIVKYSSEMIQIQYTFEKGCWPREHGLLDWSPDRSISPNGSEILRRQAAVFVESFRRKVQR